MDHLPSETSLAIFRHYRNLHKGPNLSGIDPQTGQIVPLFHPRRDLWYEHFERRGPIIIGLTPTGRATVRVLAMNTVERIDLRAIWMDLDLPE